MNKKLKIGLAIGVPVILATVGILVYNRIQKKNKMAGEYLRKVDENGGNPPLPDSQQPPGRPNLKATPLRFTRSIADRTVATRQTAGARS